MSLFGGLKYEHRIYNEDFSSREHFIEWMDDRINKLEDIRDKVKKCDESNWEMINNNQLATDLENTIDEIVEEINNTITELKDKKSSLKE